MGFPTGKPILLGVSRCMSVYLRPGIKVRIQQLDGKFAPRPLPLENDFSADKEYEILGLHCPSETAEAYLILKNDLDQIWFISNRHVRVSSIGGVKFTTEEDIAHALSL